MEQPLVHLENREVKMNWKLVSIVILLFISFLYLASQVPPFLEGAKGKIRSAIAFSGVAVFCLTLLYHRSKIALAIAFLVLLVSLMGDIDLVSHGPGASAIGLTPRYPDDFTINASGAKELYQYGSSPYGIEQKYRLPNQSISFPFPTYALYWACLGFGALGEVTAGITFTLINLVFTVLLVLVSYRLSAIKGLNLAKPDQVWFTLVLIFLIGHSQLWGVIMNGQTPILSSVFLIMAIGLAGKRSFFWDVLAGLFFAIGIMIKPNFIIFLSYFFCSWIGTLWNMSFKEGHHDLRVLIFSAFFIFLFIFASIVIPEGINRGVYSEFVQQVMPLMEHKSTLPINISLIHLMNRFFPKLVSPHLLSTLLLIGFLIWGIIKRLSWAEWLGITLMISSYTLSSYTTILLPAQFLIAKHCFSDYPVKMNDLILLLISVGLFYFGSWIGCLGLFLTFYLTYRMTILETKLTWR
jgi:hypothetical protein